MLVSGKRPERGEAAGDKAGAAQEGAAIDAAFGLGLAARLASALRRTCRSVRLISMACLPYFEVGIAIDGDRISAPSGEFGW